jgi:DNA-binding ferritin-like protein
LIVKSLLITKNAIKYYSSLGDEKSVNYYTEKIEDTEKKLWANKRKVADMTI